MTALIWIAAVIWPTAIMWRYGRMAELPRYDVRRPPR